MVSSIRAKYGPRIILSVGRLIAYKGLEFLVRAMKDVEATLLVIGTGRLREQLEKMAEDLGIGHKVRHFWGASEKCHDLL